jgi:ABC-type transport system involved in multi-copper enzyme maturation permease subunit
MWRFPFLALARRELLGSLRNGRVYLGLAAFLAAAMVAVGSQWPARWIGLNESPYYAHKLFETIKAVYLIGILALVPGMAGAAIAVEKEQESFDLLYLALLRPAGMVVAKLMSATGVLVLVAAAAAPVMATFIFLPGLDRAYVLRSGAMLAQVIVTCAVFGLMCSAYFRRTLPALAMSYVSLLLPMGGLPVLVLMFILYGLGLEDGANRLEHGLEMVTPFAVIFDDGFRTEKIVFAFGYQAVLGLAGFGAIMWLVRRPPAPARAAGERPIDDARQLRARRRRWPFYLSDPRARRAPMADGRNPLTVKETRWGLLPGDWRARVFIWSLTLFGMASLPVLAETSWRSMVELMQGVATVEMAAVLLVAPLLVVTEFSRERESGNLDLLRLTLLTPGEIVAGKLGAAFRLAAGLAGAFALAQVIFVIISPEAGTVVLAAMGVVNLAVCLVVELGLGLLASVLARRTVNAVILGYGLNLTVMVGLALGMAALKEFGGCNWVDDDLLGFFSPLLAYLVNWENYKWGQGREGVISGEWAASMLIYFGLGVGAMVASVRWFRREARG